MNFTFNVSGRIQKPVAEVFDALHNPATLSQYFTNGGATGTMDTGATVMWAFSDAPEAMEPFPVYVRESIPNQLIRFEWAARQPEGIPEDDSYMTTVEFRFDELAPGNTLVTITESGWRETEFDLLSSYGNCQGWMNMLSCMKAYLEYGIKLRKGFFA